MDQPWFCKQQEEIKFSRQKVKSIIKYPYVTLIKKENQIFLIYKEMQKGSVAYTNNSLLIYSMVNICEFPHILGSPSSYMTDPI